MNADTVLAAIKQAVGNPSCGPIKDAWQDIDAAVRSAMGEHDRGATLPAKDTRIIRAKETPEG